MNIDIILTNKLLDGFLGGANGKKSTCQCRRLKKHRFNPWVRKTSWSRKWRPTPVVLSGKFHGQMSLAAIVHEAAKSQT